MFLNCDNSLSWANLRIKFEAWLKIDCTIIEINLVNLLK